MPSSSYDATAGTAREDTGGRPPVLSRDAGGDILRVAWCSGPGTRAPGSKRVSDASRRAFGRCSRERPASPGPAHGHMVQSTLPRHGSTPTRLHGTLRGGALLVFALSTLAVAGCASMSGGENPFAGGGGGGEGERSLLIEVQNLNFNDATLHAVSSGRRERMGRVSGKSNASFRIPWQSTQPLRIEIDLLAGSDYRTNAVSASPSDQIRLVIQADLRRSYLQN